MRSLLCLLLLSLALVAAQPAPPTSVDPWTSPAVPEIPETAFEDAAVEEMAIAQAPEDVYEIEQTEQAEESPETLEIAQADEYETQQADDVEIEQAEEYEIQQGEGEPLGASYLATLRAPPKRRLAKRHIDLGVETESVKLQEAPPSPKLAALPPRRLPRQVLGKQHGPRLGLMRLPQKVSAAKEHRPVKMLAPLPPRKRAPQYRMQHIKQEVVQPVVQTQPMLHQRILTRTIYQPTLQKQPVIQRIITQPVLRRVTREQPITQQQITYQNIVKTREIKKPEVREELKVEREKKPQVTVEEKGAPLPRLTTPPKKHH